MFSRFRVGLYSLMIFLLALASAFTVIPARADNAAPPPPAAPAGPSTKSVTTPSLLSNVPAGTDVVVLNRSGHKVSLASQQAADIIASGDPIWCPTGVAPKPGVGNCTLTQSSFNFGGLLSIMGGKVVNGTVWIEASPTYEGTALLEGGPVTFGAGLGTTATHALTINGGWNGMPTGVLNPLTPTIFNVPVSITGWTNAVTVNNITISGATGTGLTVSTSGNIVLNNVDAVNNTGGDGASLDNCYNLGSGCTGTGTVTVNYSTFVNNAHDGLRVNSRHAIILRNVSAIGNTLNGTNLDNCMISAGACTTLTAQPVTLTGVNNFSSNGYNGLVVYSTGAITLGNVTANLNTSFDGVYLDNCNFNTGSGFCNTPGNNPITLKGSNNFNNNGWDGVEVWASGVLTANNLTANDNGIAIGPTDTNPVGYEMGMGAYLNNSGSPLSKGLLLTGTNSFTGNGSTGLVLDSFGATFANNITANTNGFNGNCHPSNICDGLFIPLADPLTFTLTGYGTFNGNAVDGLNATVYSSITLSNLTASFNLGRGATLDNCDNSGPGTACDFAHGNIILTGTNVFTNNANTGLDVSSGGAVTMSNVTASYNGLAHLLNNGDGVHVDNCFFNTSTQLCEVTVPKNVALTGINTFNNNYDAGAIINSTGAVIGSSVTANNNTKSNGMEVENCFISSITNHCSVTVPESVILTGINNFNNNNSDGLYVDASGAITASSLTADNNSSGDGALLYNQWGFKNFNITLSGNNVFNTNTYAGLEAYSNGNIVMSNLTADDNLGVTSFHTSSDAGGAYLENLSTTSVPVAITLTGVNTFNGNGLGPSGDGLYAYSDGAITISNLTADNNNDSGAFLNNRLYAHPLIHRNIILTGVNNFVNNTANYGLYVTATGAVSLTQITSDNNGTSGVYGIAGDAFLITCGSMFQNGQRGYDLGGLTVTLKGVFTGLNGLTDSSFPAAIVTRACPLP